MRSQRGGARQPLSVRRPKAAKKQLPGRAGRVGARAISTKTGSGAPPPKSKIAPNAEKRATQTSPGASKKRPPARGRLDLSQKRRDAIWSGLTTLYPDAHCELNFTSPWQLLVATILSAQTTDKRVNLVTPMLFERWPTPAALAAAPLAEVEAVIKSTGFFRAKAKSIVGVATAVTEQHAGLVPQTIEELVVLPGVGRKTANVVLGNAFNINVGVVVDTHVARLSNRLGLTSEGDPVKIERDLMALFPAPRWTLLSHLLIWHGRRVCDAKKPRCGDCTLRSLCPSALA